MDFSVIFRTKVFSGKRSTGLAYLPSLFDICIQVLQQNIDGIYIMKEKNMLSQLRLIQLYTLALEFTGGVPFDLLRPVLERASSTQLYSLENFNPYLLEDTDQLWKLLCEKEYRKAVREELETWRDLYLVSAAITFSLIISPLKTFINFFYRGVMKSVRHG